MAAGPSSKRHVPYYYQFIPSKVFSLLMNVIQYLSSHSPETIPSQLVVFLRVLFHRMLERKPPKLPCGSKDHDPVA
jgi:hypothetical protein